MFKIFSKVNKEEETTQENTTQEDIVTVLKEKFEFDATHIKYRVRENKYLDILLFDDKNKLYAKTAVLSKNKKMIISDNGAISLVNSFTIGFLNNSPISKIYLGSGDYSVLLHSYNFDDSLYIAYKKELSESYSKVIKTLTKIFHDVADNFDYPEVRAIEDEEKILDKLIQEEKK